MTGKPDNMAASEKWFSKISALGDIEACRKYILDLYPDLAGERFKKAAVIGAADEGRRLISICRNRKIEIVRFTDDNPGLLGMRHEGVCVAPAAELSDIDKNIPVIVASHRALDPVKRMRNMGFKTVVPFGVLQTLYPEIYPPHIFYEGWLEDIFINRSQYERLSAILKDDLSRETLDALMGYRLTGDPLVLEAVIDHELYYPKDIISFANDEVYVDAGAFDGDTIRTFISRTGSRFEKVIAFEPDPATFQRLCSNFTAEPRVVPINKGLYDKPVTLYFDSKGSRHSGIHSEGDISIEVTDLDSVLDGARATYVKMNIEAAEPEALNGARKTIEKWKPRLAVSCYHLPSHLWELAFQILSIRSDYSIHMRQHDGGVIESTLYAL